MTRYIGIRFEDRYRAPGCEPFRYDHPTVDVDADRLAELERAGDALDVPTADLLALLEPGNDDAEGMDDDDRTRLEADEIARLRAVCVQLRDACQQYDLAEIREDVDDAAELDDRNAVVVPDDVRDTVGPERYDALLAYERTRDLVALCDVALDAAVALETT